MRFTQYVRAGIGAILLVCGAAARADLATASRAYEKKDFSAAFAEFRALAELGQPIAQLQGAKLTCLAPQHAFECRATAIFVDQLVE